MHPRKPTPGSCPIPPALTPQGNFISPGLLASQGLPTSQGLSAQAISARKITRRAISTRAISARTIAPQTISPWTISARATAPQAISPWGISPILLVFSLVLLSSCVLPGVLTPESIVTPTSTPLPPTITPTPTLTPTPLPTGTPTPTPTAPTYPNLVFISMKDGSIGWGLTDNLILRTTDGGAQWQYLIPAGMVFSDLPIRGFFLDPNNAWVWVSNVPDGSRGLLYRTNDGGQSWQSAEVPFGNPYLQFVDALVGWAMWSTGAAAGSSAIEFYRTTDGGAAWEKVYALDPAKSGDSGELPFSGQKSGVTFVDKKHGWITGSQPTPGYAWLFETQDSGKTWQHVDLTLPAGYETGQLSIDPPLFFGAQDGILPVTIVTDKPVKVFYLTRNGGQTWKVFKPVEDGYFDFITFKEGWVWKGTVLYTTKDTGKNWASLTPNVDLSQVLVKLDFVTSSVGWALTMDASGVSKLYKTPDGGATWTPLW